MTSSTSYNSKELITIREDLGLNLIQGAIFSDYFVAQLGECLKSRSYNVFAILDEVKAIQNNIQTGTEDPREFKGDTLKGLWYKHWFEASFMLKNLANHFKLNSEVSEKLKEQINKSFKKVGLKRGQEISKDAVSQLSFDSTTGAYKEKYSKGRLTGERVIYFPQGESNYFLTLGFHIEDDLDLKNRILENCTTETEVLKTSFENWI